MMKTSTKAQNRPKVSTRPLLNTSSSISRPIPDGIRTDCVRFLNDLIESEDIIKRTLETAMYITDVGNHPCLEKSTCSPNGHLSDPITRWNLSKNSMGNEAGPTRAKFNYEKTPNPICTCSVEQGIDLKIVINRIRSVANQIHDSDLENLAINAESAARRLICTDIGPICPSSDRQSKSVIDPCPFRDGCNNVNACFCSHSTSEHVATLPHKHHRLSSAQRSQCIQTQPPISRQDRKKRSIYKTGVDAATQHCITESGDICATDMQNKNCSSVEKINRFVSVISTNSNALVENEDGTSSSFGNKCHHNSAFKPLSSGENELYELRDCLRKERELSELHRLRAEKLESENQSIQMKLKVNSLQLCRKQVQLEKLSNDSKNREGNLQAASDALICENELLKIRVCEQNLKIEDLNKTITTIYDRLYTMYSLGSKVIESKDMIRHVSAPKALQSPPILRHEQPPCTIDQLLDSLSLFLNRDSRSTKYTDQQLSNFPSTKFHQDCENPVQGSSLNSDCTSGLGEMKHFICNKLPESHPFIGQSVVIENYPSKGSIDKHINRLEPDHEPSALQFPKFSKIQRSNSSLSITSVSTLKTVDELEFRNGLSELDAQIAKLRISLSSE